jgi:uncharacterized protein YdeI (YjbR/CyaY-like superfamily)
MTLVPKNSVHPKNRAQLRAWLSEHYQDETGVWLISFKKSTGKARLEYDEIVEEAICFGWIDSKVNTLDEERSMLWLTPRKAGTGWSKLNKARVERMIAAGLMEAAGLAKVKKAKADGSWSALDRVEALEIPEVLRAALAAHSYAASNFEAFPRSVKRGILEWILNAKRAETRAARVAETAKMAQKNLRANQWRDKQSKKAPGKPVNA